MNVEICYRYRDFGNFKRYSSVVFENRSGVSIEDIRRRITSSLEEPRPFDAAQLRVPELFFRDFPFDPDLDHGLHEFCDVSETDLPADDGAGRDILALLSAIETAGVA